MMSNLNPLFESIFRDFGIDLTPKTLPEIEAETTKAMNEYFTAEKNFMDNPTRENREILDFTYEITFNNMMEELEYCHGRLKALNDQMEQEAQN